jgi:penicillin V acylase-like amidase (Ntn superfamily)
LNFLYSGYGNKNRKKIKTLSPPEWASYLFVPIASISSIKTIDGDISFAVLNNSLTNFGPSPLKPNKY